MKRKQAPVARKLSDCQQLSQLIIIMAEADAAEKRSQDSGYEENGEDLRSRSLKSYTSFDNSSLLSLELSDVSIFWKSLIICYCLLFVLQMCLPAPSSQASRRESANLEEKGLGRKNRAFLAVKHELAEREKNKKKRLKAAKRGKLKENPMDEV